MYPFQSILLHFKELFPFFHPSLILVSWQDEIWYWVFKRNTIYGILVSYLLSVVSQWYPSFSYFWNTKCNGIKVKVDHWNDIRLAVYL
jgi:hypothetical protein